MKRKISYIFFIIFPLLLINSCSQNIVQTPGDSETIIFQKSGLVDSVFVTCCCTSFRRYFSDTLDLSGYSKIKINFDGYTNSDGSMIDIYYHTEPSNSYHLLSLSNPALLNGLHTLEFDSPAMKLTFEIINSIFPPVCGENECKYTRSRDFTVYGIK